MTTVVAHLADSLAAASVKWFYGVVGDSIVGAEQRGKIVAWVHARHHV
jgi:hypothetical protein